MLVVLDGPSSSTTVVVVVVVVLCVVVVVAGVEIFNEGTAKRFLKGVDVALDGFDNVVEGMEVVDWDTTTGLLSLFARMV